MLGGGKAFQCVEMHRIRNSNLFRRLQAVIIAGGRVSGSCQEVELDHGDPKCNAETLVRSFRRTLIRGGTSFNIIYLKATDTQSPEVCLLPIKCIAIPVSNRDFLREINDP